MKASEWRIGNWVNGVEPYSTESKDFQVKSISEKGINCLLDNRQGDSYATDVKPIPLTEEWLLKFGLNSHNLENGYYDGTCIGHYPKSDGWYFVVDSYDDGYGGLNYTTKEIKYVHELQNLYFFWNDKELEIK